MPNPPRSCKVAIFDHRQCTYCRCILSPKWETAAVGVFRDHRQGAEKDSSTWEANGDAAHSTGESGSAIENKISKDDKGNLKVVDYSIDQGGQPLVANKASFDGGVLTYSIDRIGGKYEGKMSPDGKTRWS